MIEESYYNFLQKIINRFNLNINVQKLDDILGFIFLGIIVYIVIIIYLKKKKKEEQKKSDLVIKRKWPSIKELKEITNKSLWYILIRKCDICNSICDLLIVDISNAISAFDVLFSDKTKFIEPDTSDKWIEEHSLVLSKIGLSYIKKLKNTKSYENLLFLISEIENRINIFDQRIVEHNQEVAEIKVPIAYNLIGEIEGNRLDKQQMICIVKEFHNHLVIAGAGTGKTTTIIGKIKYLLNSDLCKPNDILVLSFTNISALEMRTRINKETGYNIEALTFHKFALNIISQVNNILPKITRINLPNFIKDQLRINMQSPQYLELLKYFLSHNLVNSKSEFDFTSESEYKEYLKINPPTTLRNEKVKSYGEMDIANFLMQNNISYIYESDYIIDTRTNDYAQYCPDFYLPDYKIYIEYFGINRKGEVPEYFTATSGENPTEIYQEGMKWKRKLHKENQTILIECFAYERSEGTLLVNLEKHLRQYSVEINPKSSDELWEEINKKENPIIEGIAELFETIITLIKSYDYSIEDVRKLNKNIENHKNNDNILLLIEPIFDSYMSLLNKNNEIDFNDMINMATKYIDQNKYTNLYKYVLVDEYQDLSKARYSLLQSLRKSRDFNLFCVGDDWQSIYRFAGSDIGFILNFKKYWGSSEISKIEKTYRFSKKLIEISGNFIMRNPNQIKKTIQGKDDSNNYIVQEICGYTEKNAINFMIEKIMNLPKDSSVFFIGRYSFDIKILKNDCFSFQYNKDGMIHITYDKRPDLKMNFITAHKAKGLQAEYVIIINNTNNRLGFPSKVPNHPILQLLLDNYDNYPYAEERRLFYVAMTRAKNNLFFLTIKNQQSNFIKELKPLYSNYSRKENSSRPQSIQYRENKKKKEFKCPRCGGTLIRRTGPYGDFWGCANYKTKGCTYKIKIKDFSKNYIKEVPKG